MCGPEHCVLDLEAGTLAWQPETDTFPGGILGLLGQWVSFS